MTDILIDKTQGNKRHSLPRCFKCNHSKYPNGKIIDPTTDRNAIQMKNGSWKCGVCLHEDFEKTTELLNRGKGNIDD